MKVINNRERRQYYSLKPLKRVNADYNLIFGEKSNGKSYAVKEEGIRNCIERGEEMIIVRRYDTEIKRSKVDMYLSDMHIDEISNGEYNEIYCYSGQIFIAKNENGKRQNVKRVGYVLAINLAQSYSGLEFPKVTMIALEEFISLDGKYLPNELFLFNHIISTVARRRNIKVYLLANSISRISPYWREYSVDDVVKTQEQGTICVIERKTLNGDIQRVAVEYCANTIARSLMFAGNRATMINEGKWLVNEQPKLPQPRDEWECLYTFVFEYKRDKFLVEYLMRGDDCCLYVTPKTTEIKSGTRVVTDRATSNQLASYGLRPINQRERLIFDMLTNGKTFYSDNQTGTEFAECLKNIRRIFT